MKLKLDENGNAVVQDGKPVYINDDGSEIAFDVVGTLDTIKRLNGEAKGHREGKEALEQQLNAFKEAGIEDPKAAAEALKTVKNLDDKKLVDAGEVDRLKQDLNKTWEEKLAAERAAREEAENGLHSERLSNRFATSKFIGEKIAVPGDMIQATFGNRFKQKDGKLVGHDEHGNPIHSKSNPGEVADFDEALSIMVERYPHRDHILKGDQRPGGGTPPDNNGGGGTGGKKQITREQFDQMDAASRSKHIEDGGAVVDN